MQRQAALNRHENGCVPSEKKIREISSRKFRQKRPFDVVPESRRFARLGVETAGLNRRPSTQSSNESPPERGTEIPDAETGAQTRPYYLTEIPIETRKENETPRSGAINATIFAKARTQRLGGGRTRARTWDPMIKS
jgi:hypothetical protein